MKKSSQYKLIIYVSTLLTFCYNQPFYTNVLKVYPFEGDNKLFIISLVFLMFALLIVLLSLISFHKILKPLLITIVITSSFTLYFMNTYNIVIDDTMIRNALQTNFNESLDLFSFKLVLYLLFFGLIPSYFIYRVKILSYSFKRELYLRLKNILLSLVIIILILLSFSKYYSSFFREHKSLRYYVNPTYWIYSIGNYVSKTFTDGEIIVKKIGENAKIVEPENEPKELVILVVGEAARADHFSLNGYKRKTNPLLEKENIFNFSNMYSCGTATAQSVPCMFSVFDKADYSYKKGLENENVLDVLNHTKDISILWRDNNSDSKGVALRVPFEDYKTAKTNSVCIEGECRDIGMLVGLDKYIEDNKGKDILIILHQMGNHGPAYYKRYPKSFEKFKPVCKTNQLEECTQEEISNAYDNALLYTDYFLSETINLLKKYDDTYETAMIYLSDHGESLGENGIYLHGLPYFMAPEAQTHIPAFMWFGSKMKEDINTSSLYNKKDKKISQDNLFHTLLGIFEVETDLYKKNMDLIDYVEE